MSYPVVYKTTVEEGRSKNIELSSKHLILLGLINRQKLEDDIEMGEFEIEIHDRDYKYSREQAAQKACFDEGGIIQTNLNPTNPYGVARFSNNLLRKI